MIYALLDKSPVVRAVHLKAAVAFWNYAEATALWVFGDALGDKVADTILRALRSQGPLTQTEIYRDVFQGHVGGDRLTRALALLHESGLAMPEERKTEGRPATIWRANDPRLSA